MKFDERKFTAVLLYILKKCQGVQSLGQTVLYKLLYFSDFDFYEINNKSITGESYRKIMFGPAPCHFKNVVDNLKKEGSIKEIRGNKERKLPTKFIPLADPDLSVLNAQELDTVNNTIQKCSTMTATQISALSHKDTPWKATKDNEIIDYELVFYRDDVLSVSKKE